MIPPPSGYTCASYLDPFIASAGGYIQNPDAASGCLYCSDSTADAWLYRSFNIQYVHRWRNVGLFCAFIVFNVRVWFYPFGWDGELTPRCADLCHVCVHVCVPDSVVWEEQGRRAASWVVCWGRPEATSEDVANTKTR